MELGNGIFGNSRGRHKHKVPRDGRAKYFYQELIRVLEDNGLYKNRGVIDKDSFENDTFIIRPYHWGICSCGWDEIDDGHKSVRELEHREDCFQKDYEKLNRERKIKYDDKVVITKNDKGYGWYIDSLIELYHKHGLDYDEDNIQKGCAVRCSCDYHDRKSNIYKEYASKFGNKGHKDGCKLVLDNFVYKPKGYRLQWYKYPLRDSYANQDLRKDEFKQIVDRCVESLKE